MEKLSSMSSTVRPWNWEENTNRFWLSQFLLGNFELSIRDQLKFWYTILSEHQTVSQTISLDPTVNISSFSYKSTFNINAFWFTTDFYVEKLNETLMSQWNTCPIKSWHSIIFDKLILFIFSSFFSSKLKTL